MTIVSFARDEIDPFRREHLKTGAEARGCTMPCCGGHVLGYFAPHEGCDVERGGRIALASLGDGEACQLRPKADDEARVNSAFATCERFTVKDERRFTDIVVAPFQRLALALEVA